MKYVLNGIDVLDIAQRYRAMCAKDQPLIDQQFRIGQPITERQETNDGENNGDTEDRNANVETDDAAGNHGKACENRRDQISPDTIGDFENQGQCMQAMLIFQAS
jgi:hypothetical protein